MLIISAVMVVLMVAAWAVGRRLQATRFADLEQWAARQQWQAHRKDQAWLPFARRTFGSVLWPKINLVLTGPAYGRQATVFEYQYRRPVKGRTWVIYAVAAVRLPRPVGFVAVTPRTLGSRLASTAGGRELSIGFAPLDSRYRIRAADVGVARALVPPPLGQWLAAIPGKGPSFLVDGEWLVTWQRDLLRPALADSLVRQALWLVAQLPGQEVPGTGRPSLPAAQVRAAIGPAGRGQARP